MAKTIIAEKICPLIVLNATICENGIDTMANPFFDAMTQAMLDPEYFCENTLVLCHDGDYEIYHAEAFINNQTKNKPAITKNNDYLNKLYNKIVNQKGRPELKMVLLTDPHVDFMYTEGADKACNNYLCCRPDSGFPTEKSRKAGPWGEYKCDLPP